MDADTDEGRPVDPSQFTPEMSKIIDEVELQWLEPKSEQITATATSIYKFDEKPSFWISIAAFISRSRTNPQSQPISLFWICLFVIPTAILFISKILF